MKGILHHILLFFTALIGSILSFWFLINQPINQNQFTKVAPIAIIINNGLFFISLFLMLYVFFFKEKFKMIIGFLLIIMGLLYLTLTFSFTEARYIYLIAVGLYIFTGLLTFGYKKL